MIFLNHKIIKLHSLKLSSKEYANVLNKCNNLLNGKQVEN